MTVATALVSDNDPLPRLAEDAIRLALEKSGAAHANGVLLFLTPEFARHAQQTITAVARIAQCTQVAGGIASGVFTESGWALDRPAAAAMILGDDLSLGPPEVGRHPVLSYAGGNFPPEWSSGGVRYGGCFSGSTGCDDALVWQQCRLTELQRCSTQLLGASLEIAVSSGLKLLGKPLRVDCSSGFDLERIGGELALKSLNHALPTHLRNHAGLLHHVNAVLVEGDDHPDTALADGRFRPTAIVTANADNSLTLAERVVPGQFLAWAIRQPDGAIVDMRQSIERVAERIEGAAQARGALMFSCIGRGPYFHGGEDGDLDVFRQRFPGLPVLGTYGTGQIAPSSATNGQMPNRLMQNAVVTALFSTRLKEEHVQPIA